MRRSEDRTLCSRSRLSTKGAGSSMKSGRVGGMSADETVNSVRRVIVSSSRLPYFPRVITPIESMGVYWGVRGIRVWRNGQLKPRPRHTEWNLGASAGLRSHTCAGVADVRGTCEYNSRKINANYSLFVDALFL